MLKFSKVILLALLFTQIIKADNFYSKRSIPDSLIQNANSVVRYHNTKIRIDDNGRLYKHVKYAITILNAAGKSDGYFYENYDKNEKLKVKSIKCFDRNGVKSKRINLKLLNDFANNGRYSFISDSRIKVAEPFGRSFPYTMEYEFEKVEKSYINIDVWKPVASSGMSVQSAKLSIQTPTNIPFRHQALNYNFNYKKSGVKDGELHQWEVRNFKALKDVAYEPPVWNYLPFVCVDPVGFTYHDYSGSMNNWNEFGKWIQKLSAERLVLPAEEVQKVKELTANMQSDFDKAKAVYEYLQSKTRYVSISLGIGGLQPMPASQVVECGYGDCKALSNYTKAMLDAIGIKSYYTIIGSGYSQYLMFDNYPSVWQANHAILTIPFPNDTLFLECTSNSLPFGYLGQSCCNRKALMITEDGGKVINIPAKKPEDNYRNRKIQLTVNGDGSATCSTNEWYGCWQYENTISRLLVQSNEDRRKFILNSLNLNTAKLNKVEVSEVKQCKPKGNLKLDLSMDKYANLLGSRLIFNLNPDVDNVSTNDASKERQLDIAVHNAYMDNDTVWVNLPEGFTVEYLPKKVEITSKYGSYKQEVQKVNENKLQYTRCLKRYEGTYDKSEYKEFANFFNAVAKADKEKVVLKKI